MLKMPIIESYSRIKRNVKAWSFSASLWQNDGSFTFRQNLLQAHFVEPLLFSFTNIKYLCLYFWVIRPKSNTAVANLDWTTVYSRIYESLRMLICYFWNFDLSNQWIFQKNYLETSTQKLVSSKLIFIRR